jgi:hypothetical protein
MVGAHGRMSYHDIDDNDEVLAVCVQPDYNEYHFIAADHTELADLLPDGSVPLDQCGECGGYEYTLSKTAVTCNECGSRYPIEGRLAAQTIF